MVPSGATRKESKVSVKRAVNYITVHVTCKLRYTQKVPPEKKIKQKHFKTSWNILKIKYLWVRRKETSEKEV